MCTSPNLLVNFSRRRLPFASVEFGRGLFSSFFFFFPPPKIAIFISSFTFFSPAQDLFLLFQGIPLGVFDCYHPSLVGTDTPILPPFFTNRPLATPLFLPLPPSLTFPRVMKKGVLFLHPPILPSSFSVKTFSPCLFGASRPTRIFRSTF